MSPVGNLIRSLARGWNLPKPLPAAHCYRPCCLLSSSEPRQATLRASVRDHPVRNMNLCGAFPIPQYNFAHGNGARVGSWDRRLEELLEPQTHCMSVV